MHHLDTILGQMQQYSDWNWPAILKLGWESETTQEDRGENLEDPRARFIAPLRKTARSRSMGAIHFAS